VIDMQLDFQSDKPIFLQIAEQIEDAIFTGAFAEESQIPSTTELSAKFSINPATVLKGMNKLTDKGLIYKKRGLGMFVSQGAAEAIRHKRQQVFFEQYVVTLITEANKLGLSQEELIRLISDNYGGEENGHKK
jgi:DNA-binding transcriptional regulator YhcF (GntR family)